MNLPPRLLPPLYDGFCYKSYLPVSKIYKLKDPKQRKPLRGGEEDDEETISLKPVIELFLELSSWSFTFHMRSQLVTSHEKYQLMAVEAKIDS